MIEIDAVPLDDAVAAKLVDELADDLDGRYGAESDGGGGWRSEVTPETVRPPDGVFLVVRVDGEPVACGALKRVDPTTAEVKRMYTRPSARRRGVARALLARLEEEAAALGYERMRLETGTEQPESVALYESAGWTPIDPYSRYADDPRSRCFEKSV